MADKRKGDSAEDEQIRGTTNEEVTEADDADDEFDDSDDDSDSDEAEDEAN